MKTANILLAAACILPLAACASHFAPAKATAELVNLNEQTIGVATLTQTPHGVKIQIRATNLPAGELAFHIHQKGICSPADKFKSAGDHFNPTGKSHGMDSPNGAHAGDMANLAVSPNGMLNTTIVNKEVTLDDNKLSGLFDTDGSALVIHAKADDYTSQPAGAAGDRIACGVIHRLP